MSVGGGRSSSDWSRRLVASLTEQGLISEETGRAALAEATQSGRPVATVLAQRRELDPRDALSELAKLSGLPTVDIFEERPMGEAFKLVPEMLAREIGAIGYRIENDRLTLACSEPLSTAELRQLSDFLDREVAGCVLADPSGIDRIMEAVYPRLGGGSASDIGPAAAAAVAPPAEATAASAPSSDPRTRRAQLDGSQAVAAQAIDPTTTGVGVIQGASNEASLGQAAPPPPPPPPPPPASPPPPARLAPPSSGRTAPAAPRTPPIPGSAAVTTGQIQMLTSQTPVVAPRSPLGGGTNQAGPLTLEEFESEFGDTSRDTFPTSGVGGIDLNDLLTYAVEHGASDLHLTNQLAPTIRIDGSLRQIDGMPRLDNEQIREMVYRVLTQSLRERFEAEKELDTSHTILGVGRFRVNVFQQRGSIGAVLRAIPHEIPAFDSLGLPEIVSSFAELRRGLVLVTGPTGSGKSTSLASLINIINRTKPLHIMTVEDPIEFLHTHQRAIVNQREVGADTASFSEALRHVLRQDPDVILVGEMRDIETISAALTAAETGHLVFATLHTQDAPQTIDRIIDVFPSSQQDQVRIQLAGSLEAVVTQQLIISATGLGRVPVAEVMVCSPAIRNLIRSAKTHQVYSLMQTGGAAGMQTMDQGLARAVKAGRITEAVAFDRCHDPSELRDHMKG
jgi:twitching motility protein PilT